ncbi:MAG TPA: ABC transporter ATP-binding protein [Candidatus Binatia bacterium]|nr:ABC transporter ATP-binding protein [Candidatus Binatia bacterium]
MMLDVRGMSKHFGGIYAVKDCTFSVKEGTITSIIGPNGAGKTTLFNLINGILVPDAGAIVFQDQVITGLKPFEIARAGISRTFQLAKVFKNLTVRDNLLLAKQATDTELQETLKKMHYARDLDAKAGDLSYGQQRLVELARATLLPHKLLLLDEPTAGVNPAVRKELATILRDLKKQGNTILLIEHDMDFVMGISDEIVVLNEGTVLAQGSPEAVQKNPRVLEAYLGK